MELVKKDIHTEKVKSKAFLQIPLETDINVSDSKPDVARVIYNSGKIKVDEIKTGMNKIWVKGKLCYQLLYKAEGGDNDLAGMDGELPFMEEVYLDKIEGPDRVICRTRLEDFRVHIINSREVGIQSGITLDPRVEVGVSEELCVELAADDHVDAGEKLEYRKKSLDYLETAVKKRDLLRVHEEAKLPAGMPDIGVPLWKNARIDTISFRPMDGKLEISGELNVFVVYREDNTGKINWYETMVPFKGSVECQNSSENMMADVDYEIGHEELTVHEDSDGELRIIGIEMTIELEIKLYEKENTSIVADVYGVSCEVDAQIDTKQFKDLLAELNMEEKLSKSIRLEESEPKLLQICHCDARVKVGDTVFQDQQITINGEIELQMLYASNEEGGGLYPVKETVAFEIAKELPELESAQVDHYAVSVMIPQQTVSIKDSSQLEWRGTMHVRVLVYNTKQENILTAVNIRPIDADVLEKLPGFAIYYAKQGDSLWQIGKKYYVSVQRIKEMNNLTKDEIKAGDKILIVK